MDSSDIQSMERRQTLNRANVGPTRSAAVSRALGLVLLFLLSPVIAFCCLLVLLTMGRPVLFRQERAGLNGAPFTIFKFRTMRPTESGEDAMFTDDIRLTPVGRLLRKSSLDELPQLLNIARGEMRFVGPRPLHTVYNTLYNDRQRTRLHVRPGITGLAQVNGRNSLGWPERLELDAQYVERRSVLLNARILVSTVRALTRTSTVGSEGTETMKPFAGEE